MDNKKLSSGWESSLKKLKKWLCNPHSFRMFQRMLCMIKLIAKIVDTASDIYSKFSD